MTDISRRTVLKRASALAGLSFAPLGRWAWAGDTDNRTAAGLAQDEGFWRQVASDYDVTGAISNLENGYWGIMSRPVMTAYIHNTEKVNRRNSFYARREYEDDLALVKTRVAAELGAEIGEIALTRGATEALQALIGGYRGLKPGDAVMYADLDYYSMIAAMDWLAARDQCSVVRIAIPEPVDHDGLIEFYHRQLTANPKVRLLLLTHVGHRTGLLIPVKAITAMARQIGVDVIVDAAHSFGQIEIGIEDIGADFIGFNLHKWIGAPIGVGALYIRANRLSAIAPNLSNTGEELHKTVGRVHTGTANFAAFLTLPTAFDYRHSLGPEKIEARLRYLRDLWVSRVRDVPGLSILTPDDQRLHAGMTSFRLAGKTSVADNKAIVETLIREHGIFTVHRDGVANGACVRVTPAVYNRASEFERLAQALRKLVKAA